MNTQEIEIARRLVACPGWVWLPGHVACDVSRPWSIRRRRLLSQGEVFGWKFDAIDGPVPRGPWRNLDGWLPDLDDELTAAGILPVVRRAWGDMDAYARPSTKGGYVFCSRTHPGGPTRGEPPRGPSEFLALLATLEAAPK